MTPLSRSASALAAFAALSLCPAPGRAQDEAPPRAEAFDPAELERLRAEAEAAAAPPVLEAPGDPAARLRAEAALEAEQGDELLFGQLLEAFGALANRLNAFNPRITVFGDVLGRVSASSADTIEEIDGEQVNLDDRIALREVELDLRADIDAYAKGVLVLAAHEEAPGEFHFEIEEGYLTLETLPWGFHAQLGRFRVPFGQTNRLHAHDLPQATRPYAQVDLFGGEGYVENGALLSWLAPFIPLELTAGILNGESDTLFGGADSDDPAWFGRTQLFAQLTDAMYLTAGASYLFGHGDRPAADQQGRARLETHVVGADFLLKWQPSQYRSLVLHGELYGLRKELESGGRDHALGGFASLQVQPLQRWFLGLRYDWSNYLEGREDTEQWALGGWVSFYTTEFLRFRLGYEHRERGGGEPDLDTIFFQATFVFGSHPVEPFWFNR